MAPQQQLRLSVQAPDSEEWRVRACRYVLGLGRDSAFLKTIANAVPRICGPWARRKCVSERWIQRKPLLFHETRQGPTGQVGNLLCAAVAQVWSRLGRGIEGDNDNRALDGRRFRIRIMPATPRPVPSSFETARSAGDSIRFPWAKVATQLISATLNAERRPGLCSCK
jgi:hypothetical protein